MDDHDLRSLLEQLHAEVESGEKVDEQDREMLKHLVADIQARLGQSEGGGTQVEPSILHLLEESIDRYEVSHPDLTLLLTKALAILCNAGI